MPPIDREAQKEAIKEAITEWMDEKFAEFGKWTFRGLIAAAFAGCVYLGSLGHVWGPK